MEKTLKILKINALSLVAIPLLLLATFFKLVAKAFEKITIFLVLGVSALILFADSCASRASSQDNNG